MKVSISISNSVNPYRKLNFLQTQNYSFYSKLCSPHSAWVEVIFKRLKKKKLFNPKKNVVSEIVI